MTLVRRELLGLAASSAAITGFARVASAQAPMIYPYPKLTQVLRRDQGRVEEIVVTVAEFTPGSASPWHMHPGAEELFCVLDGIFTVEFERREDIEIGQSETAVIPADTPHLVRTDRWAKAIVIHSRSIKNAPLLVPVKRS